MDDETVAPVARAALMNTMLGPYVAQYCRYLRHRRYAAQTRHTYLGCIAHFARWLAVEGLGLEEADEQAGRRFVSTCRTCTRCSEAAAHFQSQRPATPGLSRRNLLPSIATWTRYAVWLLAAIIHQGGQWRSSQ
jgi:hypothetical protein